MNKRRKLRPTQSAHKGRGKMAKDYSHLSKEELIKRIEKLESRKKYGLIWDEERTKEKFEKDAENALPVLKEISSKEITDKNLSKPVNILIEGDNYHALSVLNFTHQGKIDLIYIDPPYNTGNRSWRYNNDYIERDDPFRHSKWLAFMEKRLRLACNLLKPDGIIVITIDDYEMFPLGMMADEIFGEANRLANITVLNKKSGRTTDKFFATCHEYYLIYAKNAELANVSLFELSEDEAAEYKYQDEVSPYKWRDFLRTGGFSTPKERPNSYYPVYFNEKTGSISISEEKGSIEVLPIDSKGQKRVWRQTRPSLLQLIEAGDIKVEKNNGGKYSVRIKDRLKAGLKPKTVWDSPRYDAATHGTKLLESILGKSKMFDFPKSLYAVFDTVKIITKDKKGAVILDFFAGSGTTGHAVLELNKEDGGNRQFILCTNNENNICTEVCYPRIEKVIEGYMNNKKEKVAGLGSNLKYFKTSFVKKGLSQDDLKIRLTRECAEMLCLREGIFEEVKNTADYKIFKQGDRVMGIYYSLDRDALKSLKNDLNKMTDNKILYCFTLDPLGLDKNDFTDWDNVTLEPIPQKILDVYDQIYEY